MYWFINTSMSLTLCSPHPPWTFLAAALGVGVGCEVEGVGVQLISYSRGVENRSPADGRRNDLEQAVTTSIALIWFSKVLALTTNNIE